MPEGRRAASAARAGAWRDVVACCVRAAGPFPRPLVVAWRDELDAVEARVRTLERAAPQRLDARPVLDDGVHALLTLASARLGSTWQLGQLVDVAAAVELAFRATRHHAFVADMPSTPTDNTLHVLDGDWSITQAAVLVADIGPAAYRLLVRGYGAAQLARLEARAFDGGVALLPTAVALGALVGGSEDVEFPVPADGSAAHRVCRWACASLGAESGDSLTRAAAH